MRLRSWILPALAAAALGCGSSDRPPTYPVRGKLLVDGRPAAGARVFLHPSQADPTGAQPKPAGIAADDGTFEVATFTPARPDGAPEGSYRLAVMWMAPRRGTLTPGEYDKLNGKFADPAATGLTATVTRGENDLGAIDLGRRYARRK